MKKILLISILVSCLMFAQVHAQDKATFATKQDSISYAIGVDIGKNLGSTEIPLNYDVLYKGMVDFMNKGEAKIDEATCKSLIQEFSTQAQQKQMAKIKEKGDAALAKGAAFLTENKTREGVVETASGLQYEVLRPGNGPKPTMASKVVVHYEGTLLDGTKFDSSYDRGEPLDYPVAQFVRGWQEGLQLMPTGSKYKLFVPAGLAYGERGSPPTIGPNETLIFVMELLEVK